MQAHNAGAICPVVALGAYNLCKCTKHTTDFELQSKLMGELGCKCEDYK